MLEGADLGVPTANDPPPGPSFPSGCFCSASAWGPVLTPALMSAQGKVLPLRAPWVELGFRVGTGGQWVLMPELWCVQGAEGTCFWSHRVKMVPLATKEMTVNPGKR